MLAAGVCTEPLQPGHDAVLPAMYSLACSCTPQWGQEKAIMIAMVIGSRIHVARYAARGGDA